MKNIILILAITVCISGYSQQNVQKKKILLTDLILITYNNQILYINIKSNELIHFQIWKNKELILNAKGASTGTESFPVSNGKYKLVIFDTLGKTKTHNFKI